MIEWMTSGESHGKGIFVTIAGLPAGLAVDTAFVDAQLAARQKGYGRGGRMKIETDAVEVLAGVRHGVTIGSPVTLAVWNKDYENWKNKTPEPVVKPRPGHADLTGAFKYGLEADVRDVLERSSARETAARVACGALARLMLREFGIGVFARVVDFGGVVADETGLDWKTIVLRASESDVRCAANEETLRAIHERIDEARLSGDTLGGVIETVVSPAPPMLGSYAEAGKKLDARIARTVLSIQAMKGIEFGLGFGYAGTPGSLAHDEILSGRKGFSRETNRAGGIEGGMTNGRPVVFRAVMKPIPTLMKPLRTVNLATGKIDSAATERSDVTAVPAACVVIENAVAVDFADALMERYGSDDLKSVLRNFANDPTLKKFDWRGSEV